MTEAVTGAVSGAIASGAQGAANAAPASIGSLAMLAIVMVCIVACVNVFLAVRTRSIAKARDADSAR